MYVGSGYLAVRATREQGDRVNSLRWIRLVEHHLPVSDFCFLLDFSSGQPYA